MSSENSHAERSAANRQECCGGYPTLLVAQGWAGICDYCPHRPPGEEPCADNAATLLDDALWLAGIERERDWPTYECGHGATVNTTCPYRCKAWRRMKRLYEAVAK